MGAGSAIPAWRGSDLASSCANGPIHDKDGHRDESAKPDKDGRQRRLLLFLDGGRARG